MQFNFQVTGMTCAACSARVEKVTGQVPGVRQVAVNLLSGSMTVEADSPDVTGPIQDAVERAGYKAILPGAEPKPAEPPKSGDMAVRLIGSGISLVILMYFTMGHMVGLPLPHWYHGRENAMVAALLQLFLTLSPVYLNRVYFRRGLKTLWHRAPNMDSLIAVGSLASLVYGCAALLRMAYAMGHGDWATVDHYRENLYFESAAMILTLITLGKFLEERAKRKTGDAVRALMDLSPKTALVRQGDAIREVPVSQVRRGDTLVVRSGSRIPVDGTVLSGRADVDQSALTGESVPAEKAPGDPVYAATVAQTGYLEFRAETQAQDTTLAQIVRLVEQAGGSKAPIARLADRIAGVFVPTVMAISAVTLVLWLLLGYGLEFSLNRAVAVLVISCPCALGLATPVAIMVGTGRGAQLGVLFKNAEALENLHRVNTVVVDKTGTLTTGTPQVTDILPGSVSGAELLRLAAALEQKSEHPFARAILAAAKEPCPQAEGYETLPGRGVTAVVEGVRLWGGNRRLMEERGVPVPDLSGLSKTGKTPLYFAREDGAYLGAIAAADVLRPDSSNAVEELAHLGLEIVMLTGDNRDTAQSIASQAGITEVISDVLPTDKASAVETLRGKGCRVLMVGDGINDAPALATADVGMAIGAGTDIAVESADVVLMGRSLTLVAEAIRVSKATIRNIRQNLFWAFFYNCLGIPIAAGALYPVFGITLSPMLGAAAMSLSSVFVVTNALRLRMFRTKSIPAAASAEPIQIQEEISMETVIKVEGMMCNHCKARVEKVCKAVPGVQDAVVDLTAKTVTVTGSADVAALKQAIRDADYEVVED